jgi:hypothetical protein
MDKKEIRNLIKRIDESLVEVEKLKLQAKEALAGMERRSRKPKLTLVKSDKQKKPAYTKP